VVSAPQAAGVALPDQSQLAAVVKTALAKRLEPYVDAGTGRALMNAPPAAGGTVVRTTLRPEAGVTEWTLSNGATVVLKPTTLKEDQILFRAVAPGGTSLASDADFRSATVADELIAAGGVGQFNAVALDRLLAGKAVEVRPFINEIDQGLAGGATPQDLETMFQLIYLRFTQPRADPTAFAALKSQALGLLANQAASPDVVFDQAIEATLSQKNPRRNPETPATVAQWNLEKSLAFYKARFADASRFTFVFVGSFTPETIRPFVERYLASLPATRARETWRDLRIEPPKGIVTTTVEKGIAPKSQVAIVFSGPFIYDDANKLALRAMVLVLQSRLSDAIREQLGGTYSITANAQSQKLPTPEYRVRIDWTCDPARTASLIQRVFEEIAFVRSTLLTAQQVFRVQDVMLRDFDQNSQDNGYLLGQIARRYEDGDGASVAAVGQQPAQIAALSNYAIQLAAMTYLDTANYVQVTLVPETK
jgi:zinc protease